MKDRTALRESLDRAVRVVRDTYATLGMAPRCIIADVGRMLPEVITVTDPGDDGELHELRRKLVELGVTRYVLVCDVVSGDDEGIMLTAYDQGGDRQTAMIEIDDDRSLCSTQFNTVVDDEIGNLLRTFH